MPALAAIAAATVALAAALPVAYADDSDDPRSAAYYLDTGALITYGALLGYAGVELWATPLDTPRWFDAAEGGADPRGDTIPNWAIGLVIAPAAAGILATPGRARWLHIKGFAGAAATTAFATELAKNLFGRHRPDYRAGDPVTGVEDSRKSFFSGHSSLTLASTTYLALFLRAHVFSRWRGPDQALPWWEALGYAGLGAVSVYIPLSRVRDHRHHASDVITGSIVGASLAAAWFFWHESRHQRAERPDATQSAHSRTGRPSDPAFALVPMAAPTGFSLTIAF